MSNQSHAIVIGNGMAGLYSAQVLSQYFDQVTVLEAEPQEEKTHRTRGVPQSIHSHILLKRGQDIMEKLFPGIDQELLAAGAVEVTWGKDMWWYSRGGWKLHGNIGISSLACSRPLLEHAMRQRVLQHSHVRILSGLKVTSLMADEHRRQVRGVRVRNLNPNTDSNAETEMPADLTVNTSGRNSKMNEWLKDLNVPPPPETVVNPHVVYTTRTYQRIPDFQAAWRGMIFHPDPPHRCNGAFFFPMENDCWRLSLAGSFTDHAPLDEKGFMEYAKKLPGGEIFQAIKDAKPVSDISIFKRNENRIRHYEKMPRPMEGMIVLGDALCSLNPVYGQGMSVSARGADILDGLLKQRRKNGRIHLEGFAKTFQKKAVDSYADSWLITILNDYHYAGVDAPAPSAAIKFLMKYVDHVQELSTHHARSNVQYHRVAHLLSPPPSLFHPEIFVNVVRKWKSRRVSTEKKESVS